jgi:signal transduction histidine kinase
MTLAAMHTLVWGLDRRARASLAFAVMGFASVGIAWSELGMMSAQSAAEWARWVRWLQVPTLCQIVGLVVFVRLYLGTGRAWLFWTVIVLRVCILLLNFAHDPNFNFDRVDSIARVSFLGEPVSVLGQAVTSPWQWLASVSTVLAVVYMVDASISLWRRGTAQEREKALVVGGGLVFFSVTAILFSQLVAWGLLKWPTIIAPAFLVALAAMAFEMSRDILRASRLSRELRDSERALALAATAAGLGLWSWDIQSHRLWATEKARAMLGLDVAGPVDLQRLARLIPGEDRQRIRETLQQAAKNAGELEVQFRTGATGDSTRWLLAQGRFESAEDAAPALIRGVLRDVTDQRRAQEEMEELRGRLAHAGRVTVLGQLASTFAHELRQPLAAILVNVKTAQMLLQTPKPDLHTLREIVEDVYRDDRRAAEVIERLNAMLRRRPLELQPVALDSLLRDTVALLRTDALMRGVSIETIVEGDSPVVMGDRVHLSQVLINLIMNAMDAVGDLPAPRRRVIARARPIADGSVEIAVVDRGTGVPHEGAMSLFEPFFTTKPQGMGMGLCVSRTLIEWHGGRLEVENNTGEGATFCFTLPAVSETRPSAAQRRVSEGRG